MLNQSITYATLPASDIKRAVKFYKDKLGLKPDSEGPDGGFIFKTQNGCPSFRIYPSQFSGTAKNTALTFETNNIDGEMRELRSKGVVFEEYDLPGLKTVNGIAAREGMKAAWFKDTEGNILALNQDIP